MKSLLRLTAAVVIAMPAAGAPAISQAQQTIEACTSEQSLQQVIDSDGQIVSDECTEVTISALTSGGSELCLIDLAPGASGVLDRLQDVARASKYWVRCADLAAAMPGSGT